jgi:hypothetical protein
MQMNPKYRTPELQHIGTGHVLTSEFKHGGQGSSFLHSELTLLLLLLIAAKRPSLDPVAVEDPSLDAGSRINIHLLTRIAV